MLTKKYQIDESCLPLKSKFLIYAIVDPENQSILYIGRSSSGLKRPKSHFAPCNLKKKLPITRWIVNRTNNGIKPIITVLEFSENSSRLNALEMHYIRESIIEEGSLKNLTDGGGGSNGHKKSEKTKQLISEKNKGKKPSQASIDASKLAKTGKKLSPLEKERLRAASSLAIPVMCCQNNKTYYSARHAQEDFPQIKCHKTILWSARTGRTVAGLNFKFTGK